MINSSNKKLKREDIFNILNNYFLPSDDFIVISGAALVIHGVKEETTDVDIAVSEDLYQRLLRKNTCVFEEKVDNYLVWIIDNVINFSVHYYDEIDYIYCTSYKVQSLDSILILKNSLKRDKDKKDIEKILYYKTTQNKFN